METMCCLSNSSGKGIWHLFWQSFKGLSPLNIGIYPRFMKARAFFMIGTAYFCLFGVATFSLLIVCSRFHKVHSITCLLHLKEYLHMIMHCTDSSDLYFPIWIGIWGSASGFCQMNLSIPASLLSCWSSGICSAFVSKILSFFKDSFSLWHS